VDTVAHDGGEREEWIVNNLVGDLGRRVSERRRELGMSVEALADRAGMDPAFLRNLETNPSPQLTRVALWKLAAALDTTMDVVTGSGVQAPPGRADPSGRPFLDVLDRDRCDELIRPGGVGRIVFCQSRGPVALPVNFRILDGDVIFRSAGIHELTSDAALGRVSFEIDHIDEALAEGWSVLISGEGHVIEDPSELERARTMGVAPWAGGEREVYVRIVAREVTGRLIRTA